jgi:hypothetical protein
MVRLGIGKRWQLPSMLVVYAAVIILVFMLTSDWIARQTWTVVLTGAVILWYSWETKLLRDTAQRQIDAQIRPFVILRPAPGGVALENIGAGPALNIRVKDVLISEEEDFRITFPESVPLLRQGGSTPIKAISMHGTTNVGDFFVPHLNPKYATLELNLTIVYQNVDLRAYEMTQTSSPGQMLITGFTGPEAV